MTVWGRSLVIDADPTTPLWAFDAPESGDPLRDQDAIDSSWWRSARL